MYVACSSRRCSRKINQHVVGCKMNELKRIDVMAGVHVDWQATQDQLKTYERSCSSQVCSSCAGNCNLYLKASF
jgi:hypothetical protein